MGGDIEIPNEWDPRPHQQALWDYLQAGGRRAVAVWHRRAGKDSTALNWTASAALDRVGVYWHLLPTLKQARKVVWDGIDRQGRRIVDQVFPSEIRQPGPQGKNASELQIRLTNGSIWQLAGSDHFDSLVGGNPVGVVFSEWSLTDPRCWDYVRPILLENGGWAIWIYTPRGYNHGWSMYNLARRLQQENSGWFAQLLTWKDTGILTQAQIDEELATGMSASMIAQEYGCSWEAATPGAYYAEIINRLQDLGRLRPMGLEPAPVHTYWDLGMDDSTSIVFAQVLGNQFLTQHYEEHRGKGLPYYADLLGRLAHERGWVYGTHHWPHDGIVKELGTGLQRDVVARKLGISPLRVQHRLDPEVGIQAGRILLERAWFNYTQPATSGGEASLGEGVWRLVEALRQYRAEYDEEHRVYGRKPVHDWTSHPADAWRTAACSFRPENRPDEAYSTAAMGARRYMAAAQEFVP